MDAAGAQRLDIFLRRRVLPHVDAGGLYCAALKGAQLLLKKLIERLLPAFRAEPERLGGLKIAHHGNELLLLAQIDLVHAHLPQGRLAPLLRPTCQIALIDGAHRAR